MDNAKQELSVEVARLYYQLNYSQQQIASRLGISRPTISRLLKYAKEKGYIKIDIIDPFSDLDKLSYRLKEKYGLKDVHIVFSSNNEYDSIMECISKEAAKYLEKNIKDGDLCLRFFDEGSKICDEEINNRTMLISVDSLKEKEKSILVAGGEHKVREIKGALKGNFANVLITDQYTAKELLE